MWNRGKASLFLLIASVGLLGPGRALAVDEEGCLFCHQHELRVVASSGEDLDLRIWEAPGEIHHALYCSECHLDAGRVPHAALPGPAQCIGECHGQTAGAREAHRRASFGGLIESHRGLSSPGAPCRLCHRATDKAGSAGASVARCAGCHLGERDSENRGVHARFSGRGGVGSCVGCHVPHPAGSGGVKASCAAPGCHPTVTGKMMRLVGHKGGVAGGRAAEAGIVLGIAVLGLVVGRRLSPAGRKNGESA